MAKDKTEQTFSFEVVSCLIAASGMTVGAKHYELMAKMDASRSACGYEHLFRAVKKRAAEINNGTETTPKSDKKAKPGSKASTPASTASRKRGKKAAAELNGDGDDEEAKTPSKKVKAEPADGAEDELPSKGFNGSTINGLDDDLFD